MDKERKLQGNSQTQYSEREVEGDTGQMDRRSFPSSRSEERRVGKEC